MKTYTIEINGTGDIHDIVDSLQAIIAVLKEKESNPIINNFYGCGDADLHLKIKEL